MIENNQSYDTNKNNELKLDVAIIGAAATADYYQAPSWAEGEKPKDIKKYPSPIYTENL